MLEIAFSIKHRGDWSETINQTFPDQMSTILHSYRPHEVTMMMVEATNVRDPNALVEWFRDHSVITDAHLSSYDADREYAYLTLIVDYSNLGEFESVMDVVSRNSCCPTLPVMNIDGREHWRILAPDHDTANTTYTELQELGPVEIKSLKTAEVGQLLTTFTTAKSAIEELSPRQREILHQAIQAGYYDTPRSCTVDELAAKDGASLSTVGEHLRRAEAKVITALEVLLLDDRDEQLLDSHSNI